MEWTSKRHLDPVENREQRNDRWLSSKDVRVRLDLDKLRRLLVNHIEDCTMCQQDRSTSKSRAKAYPRVLVSMHVLLEEMAAVRGMLVSFGSGRGTGSRWDHHERNETSPHAPARRTLDVAQNLALSQRAAQYRSVVPAVYHEL